MRQWSDFLQSCRRTHCHCACFILLFSLSPSSLQSCHFTLRMADLILPLSLLISISSTPLSFSLSLILSLTLSTGVSLQTWELWVPMLWISSVPFSGMMRTPAAPSTAEWFSSHSFLKFSLLCIKCWDQSNSLLQLFFHKKETNWNEELELCFKHGLIISTETMFWRKEWVLSESRACLCRFLINLKNQAVSN